VPVGGGPTQVGGARNGFGNVTVATNPVVGEPASVIVKEKLVLNPLAAVVVELPAFVPGTTFEVAIGVCDIELEPNTEAETLV
jgi:hypothetical protein